MSRSRDWMNAFAFELTQDLSAPKGVNLLKDIGLMLRKFEKLFG